VTGDVQIHEMAWVTSPPRPPGAEDGGEQEPELVFVNTRFSCLASRAPRYSFAPCWRPAFISALAPEDRCHLNGLGVRDGQVRYVSALGATDTPGGWRANKQSGGILLDVPSGTVLARGLSMPHSPRWYADKLWLLESGNGRVGVVDEAAGCYESIAVLPGFTRGLDFYGRFAFIGLSQVRESALFSGIAIAELPERSCGVWVLDIISGQTVAYLKFEEAVQEIFAVAVLPGRRFPEVLNDDPARIANSFVLPDQALAEVAEPLREPAAAALPGSQGSIKGSDVES
jgi:uncharacterized protein (TIGR03032 family)